MQNIAIVYFSGTGNTAFVAKKIKAIVEKRGLYADLVNVEKDNVSFSSYDAVIIGGPVYVERYPELLLKYVEDKMKHFKGKCMLFTTQAIDKPTMTFQHAVNRLKFLDITYCRFIPMPNNFYNFMFPKTSKEESKKRIESVDEICNKAIDEFFEGKNQFYPYSKITVDMINWVYNLYYSHITKLVTKKIKVDKDKCVHCGLCEKRCPVNCIKIEENAVFNNKCLLCQRCMSGCPKDAFSYKNKKYDQYKANYNQM